MKSFQVSEFKAKCLGILEEVATTGERVTILKRGKPIAQVVPFTAQAGKYPQDKLIGTVEIRGDIISPSVPAEEWEAERPADEKISA